MNANPSLRGPKRIFAAVKNDSELELMIYDSIGESWWGGGVTATAVKQKLDEAGDVSKITLRVNSPGGDVFEASAIYSLLTQHKADVECYIDGLAASAAFTISMAADKIHISEAAMMMCHNAMGMCFGYASDMEKLADTLNKVSATMRDIYSNRSGMKADEVQALMDAETWMTAEEAVKYGFADDVIKRDDDEAQEDQARAKAWDLSKFKHAPRADATKDTKRVGGKDCTKDCFAYRPDDDHENWKLPIKSPDNDAEWEKTHIRNAISQWAKTDMPNAGEKSAARDRIKAAAKSHDIDIDEDSLKDKADDMGSADEYCACACAQCKADNCAECSNPDCDDDNCDGHDDKDEQAKAAKVAEEAAAAAEVAQLEEELALLAI